MNQIEADKLLISFKKELIGKSFLYKHKNQIKTDLFKNVTLDFTYKGDKNFIHLWLEESDGKIIHQNLIIVQISLEDDIVKDVVKIYHTKEEIISLLKLEQKPTISDEFLIKYYGSNKKEDLLNRGFLKYNSNNEESCYQFFLRVMKQNFWYNSLFKTLSISYFYNDVKCEWSFEVRFYDLNKKEVTSKTFIW